MSEASFYVPDGELFRSTELTRGPWDPDSQHAGPPSALIGRELARLPTRDGVEMRLGRITYEILRPVPIVPLRVSTEVLRPGKRVELSEATLTTEADEPLVRARAWRLRVAGDATEEPPPAPAPPPGPDEGRPMPFFETGQPVGYHSAMEYIFIEGSFREPGPATVWMRARHPLVAGEENGPLERTLLAADTGNGVSTELDWREFLFINVELSVHLHRYPVGEWVCLDARTMLAGDGIGRTETALYDVDGSIGRAEQALLIDRRAT